MTAATSELAQDDAGSARVAPERWSRGRRLKNGAIYAVVRVALALVTPLPRAVLVVFGRALGLLAWACAGSARRRAVTNVQRALGENDQRSRAIVRRSFVELGGLLGDAVTLLRPRVRCSDRLPLDENARRVLAEARAHGRGIVLVTAHLGSWERMAGSLVEAGHALTTPVRPSYDPRLERQVHAPLRRGRGVEALDRDAPSTPRALVRALRAGGIVGFLIDLNTAVASVAVPFLGRDAWTPVGPARIALRTGAPVVLAIAGRDAITVTLVRDACAPVRGPIDDEAKALTAELSAHLGEAIRRDPTRWIWMHDRWGPCRP
jgi:KDO2-lipid IV(A) lauroyltransferase